MVFDHFKSFHNGRPPLQEHSFMLNDIYNLQSPALFSEDLCHHLWYGVHSVVALHQLIFGGHAMLSFPHSCKKQ